MERRKFGGIGHQVSIIGQGSWMIADKDRAAAITALRAGVDHGMSHIDTAEMYTGAEELIAEAIEGRRDEVFLVSKVLPENASRKGTIEACENSLRRLKTDRVDCYLLHWRGRFPLSDTIDAFSQLEKEGKILTWGVSNFDVPDLEEVLEIAGPGRMVCNQVLYHLKERGIEHSVLPWCEQHGVAVVGYSPFGQGDFPKADSKGGKVLADIATTHQSTPRQVALRFLVRRPSLFTIPKAGHAEHAIENAGAGKLHLSESELSRISEAFPRGPRPKELPTL